MTTNDLQMILRGVVNHLGTSINTLTCIDNPRNATSRRGDCNGKTSRVILWQQTRATRRELNMLTYTGKAKKVAKPPKSGGRQNLISIKKAT